MAYSLPAAVTGGTVISSTTFGNPVVTSLTELQTAYPQTYTAWSSSINGGITIGNGTTGGYYSVQGKMVHAFWFFQMGTTTSITGDISLTLPVAALSQYYLGGEGVASDSSPAARYHLDVISTGATTCILRAVNSAGTYTTQVACSSTIPFTWASTDTINAYINYIAA